MKPQMDVPIIPERSRRGAGMELLGIVFVVACGILMLALGIYGLAPSVFARRGLPSGREPVAPTWPPAADPRVDALVAEVETLRLAVEDMSRALSSLRGEAPSSPGAPDPTGLLHAS